MHIQDKVAIVTGGGSGLGEAVCRHLAQQGARVIILDNAADNATRVAKEIGGVAKIVDISQAHALENIFSEIALPISVVVNCAGIAPGKRIVGKTGPMDLAFFEKVIQVNLTGTLNVMRLAAYAMMQNALLEGEERGVIINTASIAAFEGQIGQVAYSASKGGVAAMTLPAAREFAPYGIRVMTIAPGFFETPLVQHFTEEVKATLQAQTLFPTRLGLPQEYAALVSHIINNPMLNGEVIRLDGGVRMR